MNKTSFFRIIFAVVFSALAVSCGGSWDDPVIPSVVKVDSHLFKADVAGGTVSVPYSIEGYAVPAWWKYPARRPGSACLKSLWTR